MRYGEYTLNGKREWFALPGEPYPEAVTIRTRTACPKSPVIELVLVYERTNENGVPVYQVARKNAAVAG